MELSMESKACMDPPPSMPSKAPYQLRNCSPPLPVGGSVGSNLENNKHALRCYVNTASVYPLASLAHELFMNTNIVHRCTDTQAYYYIDSPCESVIHGCCFFATVTYEFHYDR